MVIGAVWLDIHHGRSDIQICMIMCETFVMADRSHKTPRNVPGKFYVDNQCLMHSTCEHFAPLNFAYDEENSCYYVCKQPETDRELAQCLEAIAGCPMAAIGSDGDNDDDA